MINRILDNLVDWIIYKIFRWERLRMAVFAEVHLYDYIDGLTDEDLETSSCYWDENDGWRGWEYNKDKNRYYFNDIPEPNIMSIFESFDDINPKDFGPEYSTDEVW